jgi:hypothetical protein
MNQGLKEKIDGIYSEMDAVRTMKEDDVCLLYNVDSREDAITLMREEIESLSGEYTEEIEDESFAVNGMWYF